MRSRLFLSLLLLAVLLPLSAVLHGCTTAGGRSDVSIRTGSDQHTKEEDLMHLLHVIVPDDSFETVINLSIMNHMARSSDNFPEEFWQEVKKEFKKEDFLRATAYPVYDRHFTHEEIRQMLQIYQIPVMQKYLEKQSTLLKETSLLAMKWGYTVGEKIQRRMEEKYGNPSEDREL